MANSPEGYITVQEAADLLGVSRQTVTRRAMDNLGQSMDSSVDSLGQPVDSRPASIVQGKNRYISRDWVLAEQNAAKGPGQPMDSSWTDLDRSGQSTDSKMDSLDSPWTDLDSRIRGLEMELLAAQGEAAALKATVAAQEAHIDTLKEALETEKGNSEGFKKALDQQQALHMASLQKRLPAGQGNTFMDWIRGLGKKK